MAVLTEEQREEALRLYLQWAYRRHNNVANIDAADAAAAVADADSWQNNNTASYVAALPASFANNTNAEEKALLFAAVSAVRNGVV